MLDEQTAKDLLDVLTMAIKPNLTAAQAEALARLSEWADRQPAFVQVLRDYETEYYKWCDANKERDANV